MGIREDIEQAPVEVLHPLRQTSPLVLASPHSGALYPEDLVAASRLDRLELRRSEDCYIDDLYGEAPRLGVPLLRARFPRAYVDPNREPYELDPSMFDGPMPKQANTTSRRVAAGLGTIAKVVSNGAEIYRQRLPVAEVDRRLTGFYHPYHEALRGLVDDTRRHFGVCLLLDCHSMPSGRSCPGDGAALTPAGPGVGVDFVLGDCHGTSCHPDLIAAVEGHLMGHGYGVVRNRPYAGGYTTLHYGRPRQGVHALQIEINRQLYMNEETYEKTPGYGRLRAALTALIERVQGVQLDAL